MANLTSYIARQNSNCSLGGANASACSPPDVLLTDAPSLFYAGAEGIGKFHMAYKELHGYTASVVCVFGIIANILNIVVLTRKNMISATNCILTGLAASDGLTMVAYLPFALRFYVLYGTELTPERNTLGAIRFLLFYACFSVVVHTVSIWLTVTLAVFRYIFIRYPRHGAIVCSLARAKLAVFLVFVVTLIVCIPNFISLTVKRQGNVTMETQQIWTVSFKQESPGDEILNKTNFWIQAILVKLLPCVGLTILSLLLVRTMKKAERKRKHLRAAANRTQKDDSDRTTSTNRTTRMLLAVVLLFLLTELPQGLLNLLTGCIKNNHFYEEIYAPLGDLVDILALINNGINFILYCTMSKQFRDTFIEIFLSSKKRQGKEFRPVPTETERTDL